MSGHNLTKFADTIKAIVEEPRTCNDLADAVDLKWDTAYGHLRILANAGLIHEIEPRKPPRGGDPAKCWAWGRPS